LTDKQLDVLNLYDRARELHLNEDFDGAREIYSRLLVNQELLVIMDSARFFFGVTYFDENNFGKSEKYFKHEVSNNPNSLWINSEYRFLAESLIAQERYLEAKKWLDKSDSQGAKARLVNLDRTIDFGSSSLFVSY
jgi:tetratricopeptide (TPR) repeat protein